MPEKFGVAEISIDYEKLAKNIEGHLSGQRTDDELIAFINDHAGDGMTEETVVSLIEEHGSDGGDGVSSETEGMLRRMASPDHTRSLGAGTPNGDYHGFGAWGQILTVEKPVHWRTATIDAEGSGTVQLEVFEMNYVDGDTYEMGDLHASRELSVAGGGQEVYPEIALPAGQYFITRDSENPTANDVVPMRRVATDVDWDAFNENDVPVTVECSWQIGRQPETDGFTDYRDSNWHRRFYYFGDMTFGFDGGE